MTFPEVAIVTLLMGIAGLFFYTFLFSVQRSVGTQEQRSENNDAARLAVERLDREIRSGNVLYPPDQELDPATGLPCVSSVPPHCGYTLRIYTQSNQTPRCVQWRVYNDRLERRSWTPNAPPSTPLAWELVTEGLVNEDRDEPPFMLDPDPSKSGRTLIIDVLAGAIGGSNEVARIQSAITGRNTTFNYPVGACQDTPPQP